MVEVSRPLPDYRSCLGGLGITPPMKVPRPEGALSNAMEAIEGDGTPWSYLSASIFARELAELGARWHGQVWSTHTVLDGDPWRHPHHWADHYEGPTERDNWQWLRSEPSEWGPVVLCEGDCVTVTFHTFSGLMPGSLYRFTDTYEVGGYAFKWDIHILAHSPSGFIF